MKFKQTAMVEFNIVALSIPKLRMFTTWMQSEGISCCYPRHGRFHIQVADADRVAAWLREHGAEEVGE